MKRSGLKHTTFGEILGGIFLLGSAVVIYVPIVARHSNLDALAFITQLPAIEFPVVVEVVLVGPGTGLLSVTLRTSGAGSSARPTASWQSAASCSSRLEAERERADTSLGSKSGEIMQSGRHR